MKERLSSVQRSLVLQIEDFSCIERYLQRTQTRFDHAEEIQTALGLREFPAVAGEFEEWGIARAWMIGDGVAPSHWVPAQRSAPEARFLAVLGRRPASAPLRFVAAAWWHVGRVSSLPSCESLPALTAGSCFGAIVCKISASTGARTWRRPGRRPDWLLAPAHRRMRDSRTAEPAAVLRVAGHFCTAHSGARSRSRPVKPGEPGRRQGPHH